MGTPSYSGSRKGALKPMYTPPFVTSPPLRLICPILFHIFHLPHLFFSPHPVLHYSSLHPSCPISRSPLPVSQPYPNVHHPLSQINTVPPPLSAVCNPLLPLCPTFYPPLPLPLPPPFAPLFPPSAPLCPPLPTQAPPPDLLIAGWFVCRVDDKCVGGGDSYPSLCFFSQLS